MSDMIPLVASAADLPEAIRYAQTRPNARWYVAQRARALGTLDQIPADWRLPVTAAAGDLSQEARDEAADEGEALPDGSFPIRDTAELEKAVHALGRAKDSDRAKRHIIKRARKLDALDKLPEAWGITASAAELVAEDTDETVELDALVAASAEGDARHLASGLGAAWDEALHPRGRDGKWITNGGKINVFNMAGDHKPTLQAVAEGVHSDPRLGTVITARVTAPGSFQGTEHRAGDVIQVLPNSVEEAPEVRAHLTGIDPSTGRYQATSVGNEHMVVDTHNDGPDPGVVSRHAMLEAAQAHADILSAPPATEHRAPSSTAHQIATKPDVPLNGSKYRSSDTVKATDEFALGKGAAAAAGKAYRANVPEVGTGAITHSIVDDTFNGTGHRVLTVNHDLGGKMGVSNGEGVHRFKLGTDAEGNPAFAHLDSEGLSMGAPTTALDDALPHGRAAIEDHLQSQGFRRIDSPDQVRSPNEAAPSVPDSVDSDDADELDSLGEQADIFEEGSDDPSDWAEDFPKMIKFAEDHGDHELARRLSKIEDSIEPEGDPDAEDTPDRDGDSAAGLLAEADDPDTFLADRQGTDQVDNAGMMSGIAAEFEQAGDHPDTTPEQRAQLAGKLEGLADREAESSSHFDGESLGLSEEETAQAEQEQQQAQAEAARVVAKLRGGDGSSTSGSPDGDPSGDGHTFKQTGDPVTTQKDYANHILDEAYGYQDSNREEGDTDPDLDGQIQDILDAPDDQTGADRAQELQRWLTANGYADGEDFQPRPGNGGGGGDSPTPGSPDGGGPSPLDGRHAGVEHPAHQDLSSKLQAAGLNKDDADEASASYLDKLNPDDFNPTSADGEMVDQALAEHLAVGNNGRGLDKSQLDHVASNVIDPQQHPESRAMLDNEYDVRGLGGAPDYRGGSAPTPTPGASDSLSQRSNDDLSRTVRESPAYAPEHRAARAELTERSASDPEVAALRTKAAQGGLSGEDRAQMQQLYDQGRITDDTYRTDSELQSFFTREKRAQRQGKLSQAGGEQLARADQELRLRGYDTSGAKAVKRDTPLPDPTDARYQAAHQAVKDAEARGDHLSDDPRDVAAHNRLLAIREKAFEQTPAGKQQAADRATAQQAAYERDLPGQLDASRRANAAQADRRAEHQATDAATTPDDRIARMSDAGLKMIAGTKSVHAPAAEAELARRNGGDGGPGGDSARRLLAGRTGTVREGGVARNVISSEVLSKESPETLHTVADSHMYSLDTRNRARALASRGGSPSSDDSMPHGTSAWAGNDPARQKIVDDRLTAESSRVRDQNATLDAEGRTREIARLEEQHKHFNTDYGPHQGPKASIEARLARLRTGGETPGRRADSNEIRNRAAGMSAEDAATRRQEESGAGAGARQAEAETAADDAARKAADFLGTGTVTKAEPDPALREGGAGIAPEEAALRQRLSSQARERDTARRAELHEEHPLVPVGDNAVTTQAARMLEPSPSPGQRAATADTKQTLRDRAKPRYGVRDERVDDNTMRHHVIDIHNGGEIVRSFKGKPNAAKHANDLNRAESSRSAPPGTDPHHLDDSQLGDEYRALVNKTEGGAADLAPGETARLRMLRHEIDSRPNRADLLAGRTPSAVEPRKAALRAKVSESQRQRLRDQGQANWNTHVGQQERAETARRKAKGLDENGNATRPISTSIVGNQMRSLGHSAQKPSRAQRNHRGQIVHGGSLPSGFKATQNPDGSVDLRYTHPEQGGSYGLSDRQRMAREQREQGIIDHFKSLGYDVTPQDGGRFRISNRDRAASSESSMPVVPGAPTVEPRKVALRSKARGLDENGNATRPISTSIASNQLRVAGHKSAGGEGGGAGFKVSAVGGANSQVNVGLAHASGATDEEKAAKRQSVHDHFRSLGYDTKADSKNPDSIQIKNRGDGKAFGDERYAPGVDPDTLDRAPVAFDTGAPSAPVGSLTDGQRVNQLVEMHGSDRSKWPTTNLRLAAKAGDPQAKDELESRTG